MSEVPVDDTFETGQTEEEFKPGPMAFNSMDEQRRLYSLDVASRIPNLGGVESLLESAEKIRDYIEGKEKEDKDD